MSAENLRRGAKSPAKSTSKHTDERVTQMQYALYGCKSLHSFREAKASEWRLVLANQPFVRVYDHSDAESSTFSVRVQCCVQAPLHTMYDLMTRYSKSVRLWETIIPAVFCVHWQQQNEANNISIGESSVPKDKKGNVTDHNYERDGFKIVRENVIVLRSTTLHAPTYRETEKEPTYCDHLGTEETASSSVLLYTSESTITSIKKERTHDQSKSVPCVYHLMRSISSRPRAQSSIIADSTKYVYEITYMAKETSKANVLRLELTLSTQNPTLTSTQRLAWMQQMYQDAIALSCIQPFLTILHQMDAVPLSPRVPSCSRGTTESTDSNQLTNSMEKKQVTFLSAQTAKDQISFTQELSSVRDPDASMYLSRGNNSDMSASSQPIECQEWKCSSSTNSNESCQAAECACRPDTDHGKLLVQVQDDISCSTSTTSKTLDETSNLEDKMTVSSIHGDNQSETSLHRQSRDSEDSESALWARAAVLHLESGRLSQEDMQSIRESTRQKPRILVYQAEKTDTE
uniref:AlNc14C67G4716 protein n=1 Tax=Albugo laibachii Nc14 TaxID=890382 RepID=F0WDJ6_9STRA|nr:AlNc14C67G4716 [Albugo laibachii Nc14]|eukprot:CCA19270.1 AlNc14C67G4716 [Albugo laibachii Nc14]